MFLPLITHPEYSYEFPAKHRFPMQKFSLLHRYLKERGIASKQNTFRPGPAKSELLELAHCKEYIKRFTANKMDAKEQRRMGLPWSEGLVKRTVISPMGTLLTAHYALAHGVACHLAGGTHHANFNFASGFCIFNDLAIAAKALISSGKARRVLIFDCDVHQGDGTARILENTPAAFTCSVHCEKNFPVRKATSDMDVNIPPACGDIDYLTAVENALEKAILLSKPDIVLYDAGVDVFRDDPLGLLNISMQAIRERDRFVISHCMRKKIPVATVIGGGYDRNQEALARRHAIVVEVAHTLLCEQAS